MKKHLSEVENVNATAARLLAGRLALNPAAVLRWSDYYSFDLIKHGYLLARHGNEFFDSVLNGKPFPVNLLEGK